MYCTKDCTCSLCRELRGYKPSDKKSAPSAPTLLSRMLNDNFILRRRGISLKNFQPQSLRNSEMLAQQMPVPRPPQTPSPTPIEELPDWATEDSSRAKKPNHKVVIYFGDSIHRGGQQSPLPSPKELHSQLLQEMSQKLKASVAEEGLTGVEKVKKVQQMAGQPETSPPANDELPPYIESVQNGVINIRIEGNYRRASALVETVAKPTLAVVAPTKSECDCDAALGDNDDGNADDDSDDPGQDEAETDSCDWSYVQEWRRAAKRYSELFESRAITYFLVPNPNANSIFNFNSHCTTAILL